VDCLFCRIARGEIPARILYQDDEAVCFADIDPKAPVHLLLIPRRHIQGLDAAGAEDAALLGRLQVLLARLAREQGLTGGYRVVTNVGPDAGQSVPHLHYHLLGGRTLRWPPG
jgi:histidine triad (HIT) family protein